MGKKGERGREGERKRERERERERRKREKGLDDWTLSLSHTHACHTVAVLKSEFMPSKLRPGLEESSIQESFQKLNLALLTGTSMPLVKANFGPLSCSAFNIGFDDGGGGGGESFESNLAADRRSGVYPESHSLLFSVDDGGEGVSPEGARCLEIVGAERESYP